MRTTYVIHLTANTHPVDPTDPVLQQEIGDTCAAAVCDQIAHGRWPNAVGITADVVEVLDTPPPNGPAVFDRETAPRTAPPDGTLTWAQVVDR